MLEVLTTPLTSSVRSQAAEMNWRRKLDGRDGYQMTSALSQRSQSLSKDNSVAANQVGSLLYLLPQ